MTAPATTDGGLRWAVSDTLAVAGRNLRSMSRVPTLIVFSTIQPVLFVLLFRYVLGGAITIPGYDYVDYLLPGIFVETMVFNGLSTIIGLAEDLRTGLVERFRSLPMARPAYLGGRAIADLFRSAAVMTLMVLVGFAVGFRIHTNVGAFLAAMFLLLAFGFSVSFIFCAMALRTPTVEAAQAASMPPMVVFVFASSAFVPVETMPGWLQAFARNQPVSAMVDAVRALVLGGDTARPVWIAIAWTVGIFVVFATLAIRHWSLKE